ncbi:PREDICTED: uncharacterized protein LOC106810513 [Priapulus caudatus]|uniref:Uncharacterized protein LOC106810513 n=1 Tax=Priapulus caudatus TaxID=37621 RepID=A0ABM1EB07_PRICU|nr:PREDICTED: uncharacterized protein LOC106810513 [Priapulus caudatus]
MISSEIKDVRIYIKHLYNKSNTECALALYNGESKSLGIKYGMSCREEENTTEGTALRPPPTTAARRWHLPTEDRPESTPVVRVAADVHSIEGSDTGLSVKFCSEPEFDVVRWSWQGVPKLAVTAPNQKAVYDRYTAVVIADLEAAPGCYESFLQIYNVQAEDETVYHCHISNSKGMSTATVAVTIGPESLGWEWILLICTLSVAAILGVTLLLMWVCHSEPQKDATTARLDSEKEDKDRLVMHEHNAPRRGSHGNGYPDTRRDRDRDDVVQF